MLNEDIKRIKQYLKDNKITYGELSKMSQIPITTLSYIFTGRTENPRMDTIKAIERALSLDEKKPLTDEIAVQVETLNIKDYLNLSKEEQLKIAQIFNAIVKVLKNK